MDEEKVEVTSQEVNNTEESVMSLDALREAYAAKKGCIKQSIQEIETYSQLTVLTEILRNDRLFRLFHSRQVQGMNQVLHMYAEYLENGKSPDLQQQNAEQQ